MKILTAITGASGIPLAIQFLQTLKKFQIERHLIVSEHAKEVCKFEHDEVILWNEHCEYLYEEKNLGANVSSGSYPLNAMVVIPCSMNTLAQIAAGLESNLITRSVAVNLKQERKVVIVPREAPLSLVHLDNLRKAKIAGCSIVPPTLAFYFRPKSIDDLIAYTIGKILELLDISHQLYNRWGENYV